MERIAVGLGARDAYLDELCGLRDPRVLDVLEVMIDDGLTDGPRTDSWRRLGTRWPLVAHGTELGIADAAGVNEGYVARVGRALRGLHVWWYSEHLAFLNGGGVALGHFGPVGADEESLAVIARGAAVFRAASSCPLLLENSADVLGFGAGGPGAGRELGRAFAAALRAAGAGALLDLTNLVIGARNDGYDPRDFLGELEWDRVVEVHLAGGHAHNGLWIDSHAHDIDKEALSLLGDVASRAPNLRAVIIERDDRLPPLERLLAEVEAVRGELRARGRR
jgi:hypothetical protein